MLCPMSKAWIKPDRDLLTGEELQREFPYLTPWKLFRMRKSRKIPFVKLGHRTFLYSRERVKVALERLETREVV